MAKGEFEQQLINAGYNKHSDMLYSALYFYQKKFKDYYGVKFYINIYKYNTFISLNSGEDEDKWEIRLQFEMPLSTMNITIFSFRFKSIEEIELYVHNLWERLEAHYYEKF